MLTNSYFGFRYLLILSAVLLPMILFSQNAVPVLKKINFEGIKKSKPDFLLRFLSSEIGKETDLQILSKDLQRLRNLTAISDAKYRLDTLGKDVTLTFEVDEALTLFPIINFGSIQGNFWYQLGFNDTHWLGRGMSFSGFYQNIDRRNNFNLYFRAPYLRGRKFGFSASLLRYASTEPLFFDTQEVYFDYTNTSATVTGIYQMSVDQSFELGGSYFVEDYKKDERHIGEVTPGPDALIQPKSLAKALYKTNKINYHFFYLFGFDNTLNLQTVYNFGDKSFFNILLNDTRFFKRIDKKGNLATRLRIGTSTNTDSPFAPFVLDSHINIRGSGNRIDRGTAALILNVEYRHTVFDKKRFAGQIVGFSDIGSWRAPGGNLSELTTGENYRQFVGGGIRFISKKAFDAILRIDYGIDIFNFEEHGAVLGIGQYF